MSIHIFGIRHHGPGSALSLRSALNALQPDYILVEGPPDANDVLPYLANKEIKPPVAILIYASESPQNAVYYPFAHFSPEWQALMYAQQHGIPSRFMDLPQMHRMAESLIPTNDEPAESQEIASEQESDSDDVDQQEAVDQDDTLDLEQFRTDPLSMIGMAAGYGDGEAWWEQFIELRHDSADQFQGILEIMKELRNTLPPETNTYELQREAYMRMTIRNVEKEGYKRIAVVCGAWHTPALAEMPSRTEDAALLKGLPKTKVSATWIPWTYGRLTYASGYGAGVASPAWYQQLFDHHGRSINDWMTRAARLLRNEDLPASTASVIEAVRTSQTIAALRNRPYPGLQELLESAQTVFCFGNDVPMRIIQEKLVVGECLGHIPDDMPMLPLQIDLRKTQKSLRLEPKAEVNKIELDLRQPTDLQRSHLLHRLTLLRIPWGLVEARQSGKGTFREQWLLKWNPEFEILVIEANVFGNTVEQATTGYLLQQCKAISELAELTPLVESTLNADLPTAIEHLMNRLQELAAVTSDIPLLMKSLPPLANVMRYGNVRQTQTDTIAHVVEGLFTRICIGLPAAASSLNDDAADALFTLLLGVNQSVSLLQNPDHSELWNTTLIQLINLQGLHGLIAGRCCRILLDRGVWDTDEIETRLNIALSPAGDIAHASGWIDGLLRDSGEILLHSDSLWAIMDNWVSNLTEDYFLQALPLIRRTFSTFPRPVRRNLGERVSSGIVLTSAVANVEDDINPIRARLVLPLVAQLLGLDYPATPTNTNLTSFTS